MNKIYRDRWVLHNMVDALLEEQSFHQMAQHVRNNPRQYPDGFHHQGMHWSQIVQEVPQQKLRPGVIRVIHMKLGPKNVTCLREEISGNKTYWVDSVHWHGHCPGCKDKIILKKRRKRLNIPQK